MRTRIPLLVTSFTLALVAVAGCGGIDEAPRSGIDHTDLLNDLATRLDGADRSAYTAEYRLAGGAPATVRWKNGRWAFGYPDGRLTVTDQAVTECDTSRSRPTCTVKPAPQPGTTPAASLFTDPGRHGMVPAPIVAGLLTAAALDNDVTIDQYDTTVASRHSTCVRADLVDNAVASAFDVCVTTEGVIGSFSGVVTGGPVEMAMTSYHDGTPGETFGPPAGARLIESR